MSFKLVILRTKHVDPPFCSDYMDNECRVHSRPRKKFQHGLTRDTNEEG